MTLIEMVLAVTLFSTMMGAAGGLVQFGLRSQVLWGTAAAPALQMEQALQRLEQDVAAAQPLFDAPVLGTAGGLALARMNRLAVGEAPVAPEWLRVTYQLIEESGQRRLVREARVWRLGAVGEPLTREALLTVTQARWTYGRLDANHQLIWAESWDGTTDGLPRLVRLEITVPTTTGSPLQLTRVFRNPSGNLPVEEIAP